MGRNPPSGAILDFHLAKGGSVLIEILDSSGNVVRALSTDKVAGTVPIKVKAGMNRVAWDLRRAAPPAPIPGVYLRRAAGGRRAVPGSYSVRLSAAGQVLTAPLQVLADPRSKATVEEFAEQDRLLVLIEQEIASLRQTVLKLLGTRDQIAASVSKLSNPAAVKTGKSLIARLETAKDAIVQHGVKRREGGVPRNLLYDYLHALHAAVNSADATLDAAEKEMYPSLREDWLGHKGRIDALLGAELEAFNKTLSRNGLPIIVASEAVAALDIDRQALDEEEEYPAEEEEDD
jgi:hypothetical protein